MSRDNSIIDEKITFTDRSDRNIDRFAMYNLQLARIVGIPAAVLYNRIVNWTRFKCDADDGWVYYTKSQFADETAFHSNTFQKAAQALVDVGLIKKKISYIPYSRRRATFFRLNNISLSRVIQMYHSSAQDCATRPLNTQNKQRVIIKENTQRVFSGSGASTASPCAPATKLEDSLDIDASIGNGNLSSIDENEVVDEPTSLCAAASGPSAEAEPDTSPFDVNVPSVSIRADEDVPLNTQARKRNYAVATSLLKHFGIKLKPSKVLAERVGGLLDSGWKLEDIVGLVEWADNDDFYSKQDSIQTKICNNAAERYLKYKEDHKFIGTADANWDEEESEKQRLELMSEPLRRILENIGYGTTEGEGEANA